MRLLTFIGATLLGAGVAAGQSAARPEDVKSVDAIMHEIYAVISGPRGEARDWARFQSLFAPGARLIRTAHDSTGTHLVVMTPQEFADHAGAAFMKMSFFENEISRKEDTFGAVTQVFSTYASHRALGDTPFARGINSFQLFYDGTRYYVVTIYWDAERPGQTIPDKYLTH
jgi:hypothetical protein